MAFPRIGPMELVLILAVVMIIFGVGRLPEVFGSFGKGVREFKKAINEDEATPAAPAATSATAAASAPAAVSAAAPAKEETKV